MKRPNIIVITCHDIGDFQSPYGHPVQTPALESMAAEGVVFENHFSTSTVCSPGRGAITTGCYPHTNGLMGLIHRGWIGNLEQYPHLATLLARQGYKPLLFGGQHEHWDPSQLGYNQLVKEDKRGAAGIAEGFCDWLRNRPAEDGPCFAAIGFGEGHRAGMNPSHFRRDSYGPADPATVQVPPWLPDIPEIREDLAWFYGAMNYIDTQVGRIIDTMQQTGRDEDTLLIFTCDHGTSFIHGKATLYDGGTKSALLVRLPGGRHGGQRISELSSHVDILPTIMELAGLEAPPYAQGDSLLPAIGGTKHEARRYVFGERNYTNFFDPARMVRDHDFKYIRKGLRTSLFDFQIPEIELSPWDWRRNRTVYEFYDSRRTQEELYDLRNDPGELNNLLDESGRLKSPRTDAPAATGSSATEAEPSSTADTLARLRQALDEHLAETDDPFRNLNIDLLMPPDLYEQVRPRQPGSR